MLETFVSSFILILSSLDLYIGFLSSKWLESQHLAAYRTASAANVPAQPQLVGFGLDRPKAAKSWMWEHTRDVHGGIVGQNEGMRDFKVKVVGKYQKCLYRQVDEVVFIWSDQLPNTFGLFWYQMMKFHLA